MLLHYYKLLGIDKYSTLKEIKKKYRKLMIETHPDKCGNDIRCKEITEAYREVLQYKLNMLEEETMEEESDGANKLIPKEFRDMGFTKIPLPGEYVRRRIELERKSKKIIKNETHKEIDDIKKELGDINTLYIENIQNNNKEKNIFYKIFDFFFGEEDNEDNEY